MSDKNNGPSTLFKMGAGSFISGAVLFGFAGLLQLINRHPLRLAPLFPPHYVNMIAQCGLVAWGVGFICALIFFFILIGRIFSMLTKKKTHSPPTKT